MKTRTKIIIGVSTVTALATIATIMFFIKVKKNKRIFTESYEVAEEGYETAYDILFPLKSRRFRFI